MIKSPDKINLWEKGLVLTQFQDTVYSGREVAEAGAGSRWEVAEVGPEAGDLIASGLNSRECCLSYLSAPPLL